MISQLAECGPVAGKAPSEQGNPRSQFSPLSGPPPSPGVLHSLPGYCGREPVLVRGDSVTAAPSAGDAIVSGSRVIEVRVAELRQLFNTIDPSPFRERDLAPHAQTVIVERARELPRDVPLALRVHLDRAAGRADEATLLGQAIHQYFKARAPGSRRSLRDLFRRGRISLVIATGCLGAVMTLSDLIGTVNDSHGVALLREGLLIGGWVAMWRPLEVFLYDWWPIRGEIRLLVRLSHMPVRIDYKETASDDAWRSDCRCSRPKRCQARNNARSNPRRLEIAKISFENLKKPSQTKRSEVSEDDSRTSSLSR
jgi:hypothetical protein